MNCRTSRISDLLVGAGLLITSAACLRADTVFDFNSVAVGTATPFSMTVNGVTATFLSPALAQFKVQPGFFAAPMNGNVLLSPGVDASPDVYISFSQSFSVISIDFATVGPGTVFLDALNSETDAGLVEAAGTIPTGFLFPQGTTTFSESAFTKVIIGSFDSAEFAIEDVDVAFPTPEPASSYLVAPLLAAVLGASRFCRKRRTANAPRAGL